MSLIEFKNLPDTSTPISAENLNANFNECKEIVESGSNSNGSYIKYNDGTMITYQEYSATFTPSDWTSWGSLYVIYMPTPPNYPVEFISKPTVTKSLSSSGVNGWLYSRGIDTTTQSAEVGVARGIVANVNATFVINVVAIGKWE